MKKKLLSICAVAALSAFTAVGFNLQNATQLSDVTLANIEAVAEGEDLPQAPCSPFKDFSCTFLVRDATGTINLDTWFDYIYVGL